MAAKDNDMDLLLDYIRGKLDPKRRRQVERDLASDTELRGFVEALRETIEEQGEIDWQALQAPAHELLKRQLQDLKASQAGGGSKQGITTFDSGLLPTPEGIRPATLETRRLRYQLEGATLELSLYPVSPGSYEIIGQLGNGPEDNQLTVVLEVDKKQFVAAANQFNLFRFPRVPARDCRLSLKRGDETIGKIDIKL